MVCAAARKDFSFFSLDLQPLGLSCGFSPISAWARKGLRGGGSWGCRSPGGDRAHGVASSHGHKNAGPSGGPSYLPGRWGLAYMERGCNGESTPFTSLNNGSSLLWWSRFPLQAFPVADFLTPIHSGCLLAANSSPLPVSALQTPCSSTQPPSAPVDTHLRVGHTGMWHRPSV